MVAREPSRAMTPPAVEVGDRTRHHIALRLLPFLFFLYIVNYEDRTNLAYAALGMSRDLGFSDEVFGLGAGIFFLTYTAMQVPGALLVEFWSARRMIFRVHDRVGVPDRADRAGPDPGPTLSGALPVGW